MKVRDRSDSNDNDDYIEGLADKDRQKNKQWNKEIPPLPPEIPNLKAQSHTSDDSDPSSKDKGSDEFDKASRNRTAKCRNMT